MSAAAAPGYTTDGFDLVAYHHLDRKPCFKLALQVVDDRWFLYATRFWEPGTTILEVTEPDSPRIVGEIPGADDPNVATWQVQVADGLLIHGLQHRPPPWGGDPSFASDEGIHIWDVADPEHPIQISRFGYAARGTHRNFYAGGKVRPCQ